MKRDYYPTEQIIITESFDGCRVNFRDLMDIKAALMGRSYKHITYSSMNRLERLLNNKELIDIEVSHIDSVFNIIGWRIHDWSTAKDWVFT